MIVTYKVLIIDDEPLARRGIRARLKRFTDFVVVGDCEDGISGVEAIRRHQPDLVFLDIEMPAMSGFEMLATLPKKTLPLVIFLTAYGEYALSAFDVHAFDYLLKPIDNARFAESIARARQRLKLNASDAVDERVNSLLSELKKRSQRYVERFVVRVGSRLTFVLTDEIDWIEAVGDYAGLHVGGRRPLLRGTLNALEARLDPNKFVRIHRSSIVQTSRIQELQTLPNRELRVRLMDGTDLKVSRTYRDRLDRWLSGRRS
jgi:two-component system LytT family response regulator